LHTVLLRRWKNAVSLCIGTRNQSKPLLCSGKRNPAAGIMLALLAEMARNESETLRERIKSGLAHARKEAWCWVGEREQR
jgi:DNA invertase Pin-like site-specific DNA recombinase